ncbi:MAG TPA: hypothetical protein DCW74_14750 [Alteromonas australica]|jgi:phage gp36-like protein|uniref:Uncharacterized protein n=1 Tax=Alteromonas australica TaxID=589873 RepID=A0A075P4P7_9ALTE|nr:MULTISPECIES: hypothetical protein [Alteromonas]MAB92655.1 hypothetical protein [Alteromonas sp.]AIF99925.1 hypothetical protein EP13_15225 [Alteromonas australica]AJP44894.1 hypothetical protein EP12_15795 [Alteromonas australica]MAF69439.1 hypothetical protein [Alteromonas sp.]MAF71728.1 hypothetical protein [Alteromonas sp.]|tara:strand:+ start:756 stop:956 length:201 start_codon:yes stop_codon:yes gene_type:complete
MEDSNQHLKTLLQNTDNAFKALMREPDSIALNQAYDDAKAELDTYMVSLKHTLSQRQEQQKHHRGR